MERGVLKVGRFGFTIVEMLVVIVLIGLLVSAAGGFYVGTYKKTLVDKSAMDFLLAAKYARVLAIERQSNCLINLDVINNRFTLAADKFNEDTRQTEQVIVRDLYFKPVQFSGDVKFEKVRIESTGFEDQQRNAVTFLPDGTARAATIQIGDGTNHLTVRISAVTGKAEIFAGTANKVKRDTIDLDMERW